MTTNWIEEFNERYSLKSTTREHGIYTQVMLDDFFNFIPTLLKKQREEIILDIGKYWIEKINEDVKKGIYTKVTLRDITNLIKSYDKTS